LYNSCIKLSNSGYLKVLIKNKYDISYIMDIYEQEKEQIEEEGQEQVVRQIANKSPYNLI
jgi:hypothetical protein